MRKILCLAFSFALASCTSQEGAIKKKALQLGEQHFQELIRDEAQNGLPQSDWLRDSYQEFIKDRSKVEVAEVALQSDSRATAVVVVESYPLPLRQTLLGIASKVDPGKTRRFNFSEAISLIAQQTGQKGEVERQPLKTYKFQKTSDSWTVLDQ